MQANRRERKDEVWRGECQTLPYRSLYNLARILLQIQQNSSKSCLTPLLSYRLPKVSHHPYISSSCIRFDPLLFIDFQQFHAIRTSHPCIRLDPSLLIDFQRFHFVRTSHPCLLLDHIAVYRLPKRLTSSSIHHFFPDTHYIAEVTHSCGGWVGVYSSQRPVKRHCLFLLVAKLKRMWTRGSTLFNSWQCSPPPLCHVAHDGS